MGNNTVEAAFIIPLIICIIMTFLYVIFAVHDRGIIHVLSDMSTREIIVCENSDDFTKVNEGDLGDTIENNIKENIGRRLILYRIDQVSVKNKKKSVNINVKAHMTVSLPFVERLVSDFIDYEYDYSAKKVDFCTAVRMLEGVKQ